jgi:hypothetical protein
MRFSSIFRPPLPSQDAEAAGSRPAETPALPVLRPGAAPELPEALDERVRLVGEWQLGEA